MPTLVNRETMTGTGQLPKFEQDLFKTGVADRELFLIPTAEVPLTNLHARETLAVDDLPLAYTAHTPCFRSEAGSYGRDTRGLIRMHEFSKVELVRIVEASTSRAGAGAAGDARRGGAAGARAGLPGGEARGRRHRASRRRSPTTSRCGCRGSRSTARSRRRRTSATFQARRAGIRTRAADGSRGFAATLNSSGMPIGRTLVAILEQGQQADGSVRIPPALVPYTGFEALKPA